MRRCGKAVDTVWHAEQVLREKFVKTILAGYCVWPAVHVLNFRFVPGELRVLFVNCVQACLLLAPTFAVRMGQWPPLHTCQYRGSRSGALYNRHISTACQMECLPWSTARLCKTCHQAIMQEQVIYQNSSVAMPRMLGITFVSPHLVHDWSLNHEDSPHCIQP